MAIITLITFAPSATVLTIILLVIPTVVLAHLIWRLISSHGLPNTLPWVGMGNHVTPIARIRANLASFFNLKDLLDEGYNQFSKNEKAYVLPYFINGHQVILPRSQLQWLLQQPDSVLSQEHVNRQFLQAEHTFFHANLVKNPVHMEVVNHELAKLLGTFTGEMVDETRACLEDLWGSDAGSWREVKLYESMLSLIARLSTRVFIGQPLCHDQDFLGACSSFNRNVALSAAALSVFPSFLRPLFAPFVTYYDYLQYQKCCRYIMPIIKERINKIHCADKLSTFDQEPCNDYIQWAIDHALNRPVVSLEELDPKVISCRFIVLCFAAIQSSVITLTNCIFDIAATSNCVSTCNLMRQEVVNETMKAGWSKSSLARMRHIDSSLRESLRLNGFIERGIMKMVVAPKGVTLPNGSRIPCGTKVGISGYSVHHDDSIYKSASTYDAFRFVGSRSESPLALVTTSDKFMGFSHGSHACPGRFFAANQLKIALAHILLHYEIEPISKRPGNQWFFGHIAPPLRDTIRVRRRKM
ncbi:hypothetical protein PFICI_14448 [Pestalotiopsis fici W106-1]|uniref:Cytochrome P450 n=1 Tax=Pestalotiopsis fici (strain W106-1 / CGMCC3.15140) TaxID=1229662 RepID=W3WK20_PESFW|nr:uncharacterized protein PFICI_14448 [Pestalotiopsis fici W106-1]ETS73502.1 hypothetical protein PFICI_14448 [Pestalotiopsis fici W106-1]